MLYKQRIQQDNVDVAGTGVNKEIERCIECISPLTQTG